MIITYHGKQFFKIAQGDTIVAYNPISNDAKTTFKISKFGSDVVLSSMNHVDSNGIENTSFGDKVPVVIDGPGDYEVKEIFIKGNLSSVKKDGKTYINTIYSVVMEDISMIFLGGLDHVLDSKERDGLVSPDIIFVPLDTLEPAPAYKMAVSFEPSLIIPMSSDENKIKLFLKEAGNDKTEIIDKLVIKKKDLNTKVAEVCVIKM